MLKALKIDFFNKRAILKAAISDLLNVFKIDLGKRRATEERVRAELFKLSCKLKALKRACAVKGGVLDLCDLSLYLKRFKRAAALKGSVAYDLDSPRQSQLSK